MCSTPKPRRAEKVTATPRVVSIMASMDSDARYRFALKANQALERKEALQQATKKKLLQEQRKLSKAELQEVLKLKQQSKGLSYWLFSASFTEIFKKLIHGH
jgi:hypothetical protein